MPTPPESTKSSLTQRLHAHAAMRWPQLADLTVRFRGGFAYVQGQLADGEMLPLCRLRYTGSASTWGFGLYLASNDRYEDQILPSPPAASPAPPKMPSTAPAVSTSDRELNPDAEVRRRLPPRTSGYDHLAQGSTVQPAGCR